MDPDQTAPIGAVCTGSMLFASILNLLVMLANYLQQTTSADGHFQMHFFLGALRVNGSKLLYPPQTLFVGGILFSRCPSVRPSVRPCVRP